MYDYQKVDDFLVRAELIARSHSKDEALLIISSEIDNCENRYLNDYVGALNFIRHDKVRDWIERNAVRIVNVSDSWGHVAASSFLNWERADKWLATGRPLSLIALDAILYCTTIGDRLN